MGRQNSAWISPVLCLAALTALAACAAPSPAANIAENAGLAPQVPGGPQNLIGATPRVLNAEFGQPALRRVDGKAQVWLYQTASCGLNLILYPDAAGVPRVTLATMADGSPAIGDCPASLQQSHIDAGMTLPAAASLGSPVTAAAGPLEPPAAS